MTVTLLVLGSVCLLTDGQNRVLPMDRRTQLLSYLACRADWVGRAHLQFLFWPDQAPEVARGNLRQLLSRVRALEVPGLEVERDRLRWRVDTDLAEFVRATEEHRWAEAIAYQRGDFLAGWVGNGTGEFAAWVERERERLRLTGRTVRLRRAQELQEGGWHLEAADLLQPLLDDTEPDEMVLRAQVEALLRAGGRDRALHACAEFVQRLQDTFGLQPTTELAALIRTLRSTDLIAVPPPRPETPASGSGLPTVSTAFFGRDLELAEITRLLVPPSVHLLTLTGPGGIGKTRLALEAAQRLTPDFPDGVSFVSLASLSDPALIAVSITDALGLPQPEGSSSLLQLVASLGPGRRLLVLDNLEHLLEGVAVLLELVRGCPGLCVLVTSRERLGLEEEWLLPLGGLDYPNQKKVGEVEGRYFDAVQLFLDRARRVRPDFTLRAADLPHLVQICQLVGGSPLALELAAVWVRSLPLAELAVEIRRNLDFLEIHQRGKAAGHHSLRAVFEYSWQLLSPLSQTTLRKLAVFRGGFQLEAARLVVGASPAVLAALIDASLLRLNADDRYVLHALVLQYLGEKLGEQPQEQSEIQAQHGRYYLALLTERGRDIYGAQSKAALTTLDEELENIRAAWCWGVGKAQVEVLGPALTQATLYFNTQARHAEGVAFFREAVHALETDPGEARNRFLGEVLIRQAWFTLLLGSHQAARVLGERGLSLVLAGSEAAIYGHNTLGAIAMTADEHAMAVQQYRAALDIAEKRDRPTLQLALLSNLSSLETALGWLDEAQTHIERLQGLSLRLGHLKGQVQGLTSAGQLALTVGRLDEARTSLEKALALVREQDQLALNVDVLRFLVQVAHEQGAFEEARTLADEALALVDEDPGEQTVLRLALGRASVALGNDQEAVTQFKEAFRLAQATNRIGIQLEGLVFVAEWHLLRGRDAAAAPLLSLASRHPLAYYTVKTRADRLLNTLRPRLSETALVEAEALGDPSRLSERVAQELAGFRLAQGG